jgi:hypothetical protein
MAPCMDIYENGRIVGIACGPRAALRTCSVCGTRKAHRLCDFCVEGLDRPTCDAALCDDCRVVVEGADWCPDHEDRAR